MMLKQRNLSRVEWQLMNICWERGTLSARDIYTETLREKRRTYQAVKNMLDRLVEKQYLTRKKFGPIWLYTPAVPRERILAREIDTFVDTVLDHAVAPLFARFAEREKLAKEDIEELKRLIRSHEEEK
jgi:BlaI family penicillinase repressor